jgi:hypothetical protein
VCGGVCLTNVHKPEAEYTFWRPSIILCLPSPFPAGALTGLKGKFELYVNPAERPDKRLLSDEDLDTAMARAAKGEYDRKFVFGRRNGHWVISTFPPPKMCVFLPSCEMPFHSMLCP